jgi:hypothetical protein
MEEESNVVDTVSEIIGELAKVKIEKLVQKSTGKLSTSFNKNKIKLNVGGKIFTTTLNTLTTEKNTFFNSMFSEQFKPQPDEDGEFFIDRNPEYFHLILDYLEIQQKK